MKFTKWDSICYWGGTLDIEGKTGVSVVIGTRNRPIEIRRCLDSLVPQLGDMDELIIVDATDGNETREIVSGYLAKCKNFIYLRDKTNGLPRVLNRVYGQFASCPIIAILDDDMVVCPTWIASIKKWFQILQDADAVGGQTMNRIPQRIEIEIANKNPFAKLYDIFMMDGHLLDYQMQTDWGGYSIGVVPEHLPMRVTTLRHGNMAIKKTVFEKLGGYDCDFFYYGFDGELFNRMNSQGYRMYSIPDASADHYPGSQGNTRSIFYLGHDMAIFMKKLKPASICSRIKKRINLLAFIFYCLFNHRSNSYYDVIVAIRGVLAGLKGVSLTSSVDSMQYSQFIQK